MKIFVSHSSQQKLFVRELRRMLPPSLALWVDEYEIIAGDVIDERLYDSIHAECDLFLLVVDHFSASSSWVKRELQWALEVERRLGGTFMIPIVLDREAWRSLATSHALTTRKYLACPDFAEPSLAALAVSLASEVLAWLCRERERAVTASGEQSLLASLEEADAVAARYAQKIRTIVHPYRHESPLALVELARRMGESSREDSLDLVSLQSLLRRIQRSGLLEGLFFDGSVIYVAQEQYAHKIDLHARSKIEIAEVASRMITSGMSVGVDGGTTTLAVVKKITDLVHASVLSGVHIYTNSIPVATTVLDMLSAVRTTDQDVRCRVTLMGGWCRPASMTTVGALSQGVESTGVNELPDSLDICFIGTNGIYRTEGFGIRHAFEVPAKWEMLKRSRRKVILADPSKFLVQQETPFAYFSDGLEIVTVKRPGYEDAIARLNDAIAGTNSSLVYC